MVWALETWSTYYLNLKRKAITNHVLRNILYTYYFFEVVKNDFSFQFTYLFSKY